MFSEFETSRHNSKPVSRLKIEENKRLGNGTSRRRCRHLSLGVARRLLLLSVDVIQETKNVPGRVHAPGDPVA
jgi:hypothetical protein